MQLVPQGLVCLELDFGSEWWLTAGASWGLTQLISKHTPGPRPIGICGVSRPTNAPSAACYFMANAFAIFHGVGRNVHSLQPHSSREPVRLSWENS